MITISGIDHSPWTQVVMLGCEQHSLPYRLVSYPISLKTIWKYGLMMPTVRFPNGDVVVDSLEVLYYLENDFENQANKSCQFGLSEKDKKKRVVQQARFTFLFFYYVLTRADKKTFRFFKGWSRSASVTDKPGQKLASFLCKPFLALYFFFLINLAIIREKIKKQPLFKVEKFVEALSKWEEKLVAQPFLDGNQPGYADLNMYGHYQTMHTGLSDEVLPHLQEKPRLVDWSQRMEGLFSTYSHGYSFQKPGQLKVASKLEQVIFWTLFAFYIICFPITLSLALFLYSIRALRGR